MARRSYLWYSIVVRALTAITAVLSIVVMVVSAFTLARTLTDEGEIAKALDKPTDITTDSDGSTHSPIQPESDGHKLYKTVFLACLGVAIFAGFLQLVASLNALCSCSKNVGGRVHTWLIINGISFLLLVLCFLLPFSFHKNKNDARGFSEFGSELMDHFGTLKTIIDEHKKDEILVANLFSYTLLGNNLVVLCFMILLGCCLRCGEYAYESVY